MTEHPILFSAPMVRAILANQKTQTRRIMKPQPSVRPMDLGADGPYIPVLTFKKRKGSGRWLWPNAKEFIEAEAPHPIGSRLWVRESTWIWCVRKSHGLTKTDRPRSRYVPVGQHVVYCADAPKPTTRIDNHLAHGWKHKSGRFMPKWASRITLEVTNVRVQRVQDITEEDAVAEGVDSLIADLSHRGNDKWAQYSVQAARDQGKHRPGWATRASLFAMLFNSINPGAWDRNDWVFAYTFKRVPHGQ
jgi:hypothetical protein